jgi:hypothetical protein
MGAQIGPRDDPHRFDVGRPDLLRAVTGIKPEESKYAFLEAAGYKSVQRLVLADVNSGVLAALFPGELKPHAQYLYSDHRAEAFVRIASEAGWEVDCNPHIAFYRASVHQRLYLDPVIDLKKYVKLWQGPGWERIGRYSPEELTASLWPWLKEQGCATAADDPVFGEFLRLLGSRRGGDLRPGLRAERTWFADEVAARPASQLAADVRAAVNRVLRAIGEPSLPTG